MKSDYIANAIGEADDKYIDEYGKMEPVKKGKTVVIAVAAAAAALVALVIFAGGGRKIKNSFKIGDDINYAGGESVDSQTVKQNGDETKAVYKSEYVDPCYSLEGSFAVFGDKKFSDYVQKDIYSYSEDSILFEIKEAVWDGFRGKLLFKYTALNDEGRKWLADHYFGSQIKVWSGFFAEGKTDSGQNVEYALGGGTFKKADDTGYNVAYFVLDMYLYYNKYYVENGSMRLEFRMPSGVCNADLSGIKKLEGRLYKVEECEGRAHGSFSPSYIWTSGITTRFFFNEANVEVLQADDDVKIENYYTTAMYYSVESTAFGKESLIKLNNTERLNLTENDNDKKYGKYYYEMNGRVDIIQNGAFVKPEGMSDEEWQLRSLGGTYNFIAYDSYFYKRIDITADWFGSMLTIIDPDSFTEVTATYIVPPDEVEGGRYRQDKCPLVKVK